MVVLSIIVFKRVVKDLRINIYSGYFVDGTFTGKRSLFTVYNVTGGT
jgi:hypothetical protein